ncbi:hypothetical protein KR054_005875 [Drosophila jambulina]|nr:hypothetical protein KR054_005875 [Drosophila jambulina]
MKMNSNPAYRSVVLDCLRENACNMRQEHQDLASRISIALEHSRTNLLNVEKLNLELQKMKVTVSDAMLNICGAKANVYTKVVCENLLSHLINAAVEFVVMGSIPVNQISEFESIEVPIEDDVQASKSLTEVSPRVSALNSEEPIPHLELENIYNAATK